MFKEWKAVLKKPTFLIVMLGIALIPALYNVIFLSSMWDPYDKVEHLPVAVVNQDVKASFEGKELAIGDSMVQKLKKQKGMDWQFVDEKKAKDGLEEGDYYMILTLPKDLSKQAASLLSDQPQEMVIQYEVSSGHSFIASKMSDTAMEKLKTSVAAQVTTSYNETLFEKMGDLKTGMKTAAQGSKDLGAGMIKLKDGSQVLATNLDTLAASSLTFQSGADKLSSGLITYTNGVATLADGSQLLASKSAQLQAGGQSLVNAANSSDLQALVDGSNQLATGLSQINDQIQAHPVSEEDKQALANLSTALTSLETSLNSLPDKTQIQTDLETNLTALLTSAQTILSTVQAQESQNLASLRATQTYQGLSADQQAELEGAITAASSQVTTEVQSILTSASSIKTQLASAGATDLTTLKTNATSLVSSANAKLGQINQLVGAYDQIGTILNSQIVPGANQVAGGVATLQGQLQVGSAQLNEGITAYTGAVDQIASGAGQLKANNDQLVAGAGALADGAGKIADGSGKLAAGGQQLTAGLDTASQGTDKLGSGLSQASKELDKAKTGKDNADKLANPASLKRSDKSQVAVNGVAMAPYMISVALFVAAISTNTIFVELPSGRKPKNRWDWFKARAEVNGLIAVVAAFLVYAAVHLLGLTAKHEGAMLALTVLASLTFMAMVTALTTWNKKLGAFFSLILLLLQLASSAGTYPIQLSAKIYQTLHPFLPMTYSVSGLRSAISMTGHIGSQMTVLSVFLLAFIGLGALFYKADVQD